jgi:hypothetical protein
MQSQVLFPLHEDLTPDPPCFEPSIWILPFRILSNRVLTVLIREVKSEVRHDAIRLNELGNLEEDVEAYSCSHIDAETADSLHIMNVYSRRPTSDHTVLRDRFLPTLS